MGPFIEALASGARKVCARPPLPSKLPPRPRRLRPLVPRANPEPSMPDPPENRGLTLVPRICWYAVREDGSPGDIPEAEDTTADFFVDLGDTAKTAALRLGFLTGVMTFSPTPRPSTTSPVSLARALVLLPTAGA